MLKAPTRSSWNKTGFYCVSLPRFLLPSTAVPALAPPQHVHPRLPTALALGSSLTMVHGVQLPNLPPLLTPAPLLLAVPGGPRLEELPLIASCRACSGPSAELPTSAEPPCCSQHSASEAMLVERRGLEQL